ncbi:MAG: hypothetical protein IT318_14905 [Anaerolineales bacterium]|nr:hypothetical protein [Anaerolineales bacterium]
MFAEAALGAIAQTILATAAEVYDFESKARQWLGRDPAQLALKKALARTYTAFARQYPDLAAGLFNESFLKTEAAPELARLLARHSHPDPARLAERWAVSVWGAGVAPMTAQKREAWREHAMPAATDFLLWFEAELKAEPSLQALFDSRNLEALEARMDELTAELRRALDLALERANAQPVFEGGVNIAGDFVSGDKHVNIGAIYNTYYTGTGDFNTLRDLYIPPDGVFQRVRAADFVGRQWLETRLDAYLNDPAQPYGAFVVEGEAGVGKTSFLAHLVRERRYLHLFAEQAPGDANLVRALQSLGSQIVSRYRLEEYAQRNTLPAIAAYPDFLSRLLRAAAETLTAGEKLVVVCDALDEAGTAPNGNVFGLPEVLPPCVYLVLSRRPAPARRLHFKEFQPHVEVLRAESDDNRADMSAYLHGVARKPAIAAQLQAQGYTESEFVETLAAKSGGVWMYLHYVLDDVARGRRAPLDLGRLPGGLVSYYADYWGRWRADIEKWDTLYAPLLAILAIAQAPINAEIWAEWSGTATTTFALQRLAGDEWGAFVLKREGSYQIYHASLRDFLSGLGGDDANYPDDFAGEMRERAQAAHARVVAHYRQVCNGDWPALVEEEYPRRFLALHMAGADDETALRGLVTHSNLWAESRERVEGHLAGYLADLVLVWSRAQRRGTWDMGQQIRCGLIQSSVNSLAANVSPELLVQLVEEHLWSPAQALSRIGYLANSWGRSDSLAKLAPLLPEELLADALAIAQGTNHEAARAAALSRLAIYLPKALLSTALAAVRTIHGEWWRAVALSDMASRLPDGLLTEALAMARGMRDESARAYACVVLAGQLPQAVRSVVVGDALAAVQTIQGDFTRATILVRLARHLPNDLRMTVVSEALAIARVIKDDGNRAALLSELASVLPDDQRADVVAETLAIIRKKSADENRVRQLSRLAENLPEAERRAVVAEALSTVTRLGDEWECARALANLVEHMSSDSPDEAAAIVVAARKIQDSWARAFALSHIAPHLPDHHRAAVVADGLAAAREIGGGEAQAEVMSRLADCLSIGQRTTVILEALAASRTIRDEVARAIVFVSLADYLLEGQQAIAVSEALAVARGNEDKEKCASVLSNLAAQRSGSERAALAAEALMTARMVAREWPRSRALIGASPYLPEGLLAEALQIVRDIKDEEARAAALGDLAEYMSEGLLAEALLTVREIQDEEAQAHALGRLATYLPEGLLAEALATAEGIRNSDARVIALSGLAAYLTEELLVEVVAAVWGIEDEWERAIALGRLAAKLPERLLVEALEATQAIENEIDRALALSGIAEHLPKNLLPDALVVARGIENQWARAIALSGLTPHVLVADRTAVREEALVAAAASYNPEFYGSDLVFSRLPALLADSTIDWYALWPQTLQALAQHGRPSLLNAQADLAPLIHFLGGDETIAETFRAIRDVTTWWP